MRLTADRDGTIWRENSLQDCLLEWMYSHRIGCQILKLLVRPAVSRFGGMILSSGISRVLIRPFIKSHSIHMEEYARERYGSYNAFFKRRLAPGARRVEMDSDTFISPCDSRLGVYRLDEEKSFTIKHTVYTAADLLRDRRLAQRYAQGYVWIFRLQVEDYHRYIYVDDGRESRRRRIPGIFHTVNPAACEKYPVYKENTREYSLLRTEHFGDVIQMEVGALLVGKIENRPRKKQVKRGQEKGNFAFGGSTVVLFTQAGQVYPDQDLLENSKRGMETKVKLGEHIGSREK